MNSTGGDLKGLFREIPQKFYDFLRRFAALVAATEAYEYVDDTVKRGRLTFV